MNKVLLFTVSANVNSLVSGNLELNMEVNAQESMTTKEYEDFLEGIQKAAAASYSAIMRNLMENFEPEEDGEN